MGDRCSGHCCRSFSLPFSPADIERMRVALAGEEAWPEDLIYPMDAEVLVPMLVYLGEHANPPHGRLSPELVHPVDGMRYHWYTCSHLQENGDCGIYAERPSMCSLYPYEKGCKWLDCEWDAAKLVPDADGRIHLPVAP